jgi:hypothetical protein
MIGGAPTQASQEGQEEEGKERKEVQGAQER